ncbi:hypothetical protein PJI16_19935 [Nitrospira sp. MA-1]|nr:hypothetical protein [Nitrospira sp. MA-1]
MPQWPANLSCDVFSVPRSGLWPDVLLKIGNNVLGDEGVNDLAGCFSLVDVAVGGASGWNRTSDPRAYKTFLRENPPATALLEAPFTSLDFAIMSFRVKKK